MEKEKIENIASDSMPEIKETEKKEIILTEEQQFSKRRIIDLLKNGNDVRDEHEWSWAFRNLPEEVRNSQELYEAAKLGLAKNYSNNNEDVANKNIKRFSIPMGIVIEANKDAFSNKLTRTNNIFFKEHTIIWRNKLRDKFSVSEKDIERLAQKAVSSLFDKVNNDRSYLGKEFIDQIILIKENFNLVFTHEIKEKIPKALAKFIFAGNLHLAIKLAQEFSVAPNDIISSKELQQSVIDTIGNELTKGLNARNSAENVELIQKSFPLSEIYCRSYIEQNIQSEKFEHLIKISLHVNKFRAVLISFVQDQKYIASNNELPFSERKKSIEILYGMAENGETSISEEFSQIIKSRSKQKEVPESKWGLDPIQEAAFYTLLRLDNPNSNEALFGLLFNENINETVKHAVVRKLIRKDRGFFNKENKEVLKQWIHSESRENLDWQDLRFVNAIINDIASTETKEKSLRHIDGLSVATRLTQENDEETSKNINQLWQEKYNNIPENCFLQLYKFTQGDKDLMDKFQILYTAIKKETTKKENLLYGIVNSLEINPAMLNLLVDKLKEVNFNTKQDADDLSNLFRRALFINSIEKISAHRNYEDDEYYEEEYPDDEDRRDKNKNSEVDWEITDIFSRKITNLAELENLLKEVATKNIQKVLPNSEITVEKIEVVLDKWQGDLEPIFTYLSRFPHLKEYVAEIVAHIDTEENWQKWRYNLKNKIVKQQIGHLSESQLKVWQENHLAELGDIMVAQSEINKPRHIRALLQDSIMQHKHIYNPEMGQNKNEFIQKIIENAYNQISKNPEQDSQIIDKETSAIVGDIKQIDVIIKQSNIAKLRQILKNNFSENKEVKFNAETKNSLNFITSFLSKEMSAGVLEYYRKNEEEKQKITADGILTQEIREALEKNILDTEEKAKKIIESSEIWEKFSLDKTNLKNLGPVYQKRQELKAIVDLLRLSNLSNKLIATNRISEKEGKKEAGETISTVLENLKKYFKDSPLLQDLQNVEFSLKEKQEFGEKRRLAMVFTDNPQILWQVGKYPLGCGSCQNYAEGSHASHLMGYVGDANCKAVYLVDLNKLSKDIKDKLEQNGFEQIKDNLTASELLNISLARSIVKMTKDKDNKPVILLEPTYSSINKGDFTMDKYFNLFIDLMVAEPMQAKMARGDGSESISRGASRSPGDQYEDLDLSKVSFIHKLSKPTKEEEEIMERVRSSR